MTDAIHGGELDQLLHAQRELNRAEIQQLQEAGDAGFAELWTTMARRARLTYSVADPTRFQQCVSQHMDSGELEDMASADLYTCPQCGLLLKDRRTPLASAILVERGRIRDLYLEAENADPVDRPVLLARLRRALNL